MLNIALEWSGAHLARSDQFTAHGVWNLWGRLVPKVVIDEKKSSHSRKINLTLARLIW